MFTREVGGPKIDPKRAVDEDGDFEESFGPKRSTVNDDDDDDPTCFAFSIFFFPNLLQ